MKSETTTDMSGIATSEVGGKQRFEVLPEFELRTGSTPTNRYSAHQPSSFLQLQLQQLMTQNTVVW